MGLYIDKYRQEVKKLKTPRQRAYFLIGEFTEKKIPFQPHLVMRKIAAYAKFFLINEGIKIDISNSRRSGANAVCTYLRMKGRCHRCSLFMRNPRLCLHPNGPRGKPDFVKKLEHTWRFR